MNYNHNHILCPFNYCSCLCCICNCCYGCQCLCHQVQNKTTRNNYSESNTSNMSTKTRLSNYSNKVYIRNKYTNRNDIYNLSQNKNNLKKISLSNNYLCKRIFQERLNKYPENKNNKLVHSRSLSQLSNIRNRKGNKDYSYNSEKNFNKSYVNEFYRNKSLYTPFTERQKILIQNKKFKWNDKYINIRGTCSEEKNISKGEKIYDRFYNPKNDINNNHFSKYEEEQNLLHPNNYFEKNRKHRSCVNSANKNDKIIDTLINNRKRKDIYINLEPNKNLLLQKTNNNKESELLEDEYDFNYNNINDYNNNKLNNYINENEGNNNNYTNGQKNYKYINLVKNSKQKNQSKKLNYENKNLYDDTNNYEKIKRNDSNNDDYFNYNNNGLDNNSQNPYNKKNYKFPKNKSLIIYSFSFSINKSISLIDKNEFQYMKNELLYKNNEILVYKNKINLLKNQLEFYKNENKKLKNELIQNANIKKNEKGNYFIYRKKSKDDINSNVTDNNDYKKEKNSLKFLINKGNDFHINNKNINIKREEKKISNKRNKIEKSLGLSSKLNLKTDLNISKDNDYISQYLKNNNISDKCIYAISSLNKSKSILCFDYINKNFYFRDFADFGEFQENYLFSFENNNAFSKNNSIYLVINYNYYIVTGENCDMLYVYNSLKRTMNKLCSLKNNHANGALINYSNSIICVSGNYNKKVELFNQSKNEWKNLPELNIERRDFSICLIKNKYIFCLFGYNFPTKQYLNTIEFLDIENYNSNSWKYLNYKNENLISLYITGALAINYNNEKIIIAGGNNEKGNIANEYFYQIIISQNFEKDRESYVEKTKRKLKDINKNKCYAFNKGYNLFLDNNNLYYMAFDDYLRAHIFQVNNMVHDVFYFE